MSAASARRAAEPLAWALVAAASLVLLATIVVAVPPNMDEYVHYHPIACAAFPLAHLHDLRAGCDGALDLAVFGYWLPLRSYRYIGAGTALWYLPLYELWPSRHGPRLLGLLWLLLTALGVARLARVPLRVAWLACALCVPLAFLLLVDTGPVGYQVAASVWAVVLLRHVLRKPTDAGSLGASALLGLVLFLAVEQKPFFVYQLPAIALLGVLLAFLEVRDEPARRPGLGGAALRLAPAALVFALTTTLLLGAETRRGYAYLYDLSRVGAAIPLLDFGAQLEHLRSGHLLEYLTDFRSFGHRVYGFHAAELEPATLLYWLCVVAAVALALRWSSRPRALARMLVACALAFAGTLYLVNLNRLAWGGHHVIGAWPFLVAALAFALGESWRAGRRGAVLGFFVVVALSQAWALRGVVTRRPDPISSWDLVAIHDHLDGASGLARGVCGRSRSASTASSPSCAGASPARTSRCSTPRSRASSAATCLVSRPTATGSSGSRSEQSDPEIVVIGRTSDPPAIVSPEFTLGEGTAAAATDGVAGACPIGRQCLVRLGTRDAVDGRVVETGGAWGCYPIGARQALALQSCGGTVDGGCPGARCCLDDPRDGCTASSGVDCAGLCVPGECSSPGDCVDASGDYSGPARAAAAAARPPARSRSRAPTRRPSPSCSRVATSRRARTATPSRAVR